MTFNLGTSARGFVASAAILTTAQYVSAAVGFITTLVAARWLGPEAFGVAAVIMAYPTAVSSFTSVKTATVTQRYASGFRSMRQHPELLAVSKLGFTIDFAVSALAAFLVVLAILVIGDLPGTNGNSDLVLIFALSLPAGSFVGTSIVVMSAFEDYRLIATLQIMQKVLLLFVVVGALLISTNISAFVLGTAVGQAASGLIYLAVASALLQRAVGNRWWGASLGSLHGLRRELRSLLGWNFIGVTLSGAMVQLPVLLLGAIRSPVDAGYFRLASTIAVTADAIEAAMSRVAYFALATAEARMDIQRIARLVIGWSRREAVLGVLAVVIGMALLPALVVVALGRQYMEMVPGAELLLLGTAVSTGFFYVIPYLYSRRKVKTWVGAYALYALFALAVGSILAEAGGFFAFAAVVGIGLALLNIALGMPILRRVRRMAALAVPADVVTPTSAPAGQKS
jgi:O-antigen/teichoic acid export membrane protein